MTRALLLNNGLAWAAYQEGALRHLITEQGMSFDQYAGSGFGALNAAFAACQEMDALASFWQHVSWRKLTAINWRSPWRTGPLRLKPLRAFIGDHVNEHKLQERGVQLLFNCLDTSSGQEKIFCYPGDELPLLDALTAALSLPGLMPPVPGKTGSAQWVDGTLINSFIMQTVIQTAVNECWVIAAATPEPGQDQLPKRYSNWRTILSRSLQLNQSQDVRLGITFAQQFRAAAAAQQQVAAQLTALAAQVPDPEEKARLHHALSALCQQSALPHNEAAIPATVLLTPSQDLAFPMWRFKRKWVAAARASGYSDARHLWQQKGESA